MLFSTPVCSSNTPASHLLKMRECRTGKLKFQLRKSLCNLNQVSKNVPCYIIREGMEKYRLAWHWKLFCLWLTEVKKPLNEDASGKSQTKPIQPPGSHSWEQWSDFQVSSCSSWYQCRGLLQSFEPASAVLLFLHHHSNGGKMVFNSPTSFCAAASAPVLVCRVLLQIEKLRRTVLFC